MIQTPPPATAPRTRLFYPSKVPAKSWCIRRACRPEDQVLAAGIERKYEAWERFAAEKSCSLSVGRGVGIGHGRDQRVMRVLFSQIASNELRRVLPNLPSGFANLLPGH